MIYIIAGNIWRFAKWFWLSVVVAFVIATAGNLMVTPSSNLTNLLIIKYILLSMSSSINRITTISTTLLFIFITLASLIISENESYFKSGEALRKYLQAVIENNQGLNPKGILNNLKL